MKKRLMSVNVRVKGVHVNVCKTGLKQIRAYNL